MRLSYGMVLPAIPVILSLAVVLHGQQQEDLTPEINRIRNELVSVQNERGRVGEEKEKDAQDFEAYRKRIRETMHSTRHEIDSIELENSQAGETLEAIALYKKAALSGENPALACFNLASAYYQIDSLPQSIVYYKPIISSATDFFRAHLNLAIAYFTLYDIGATIASAQRALDIEPQDEKTHFILG